MQMGINVSGVADLKWLCQALTIILDFKSEYGKNTPT